MKLLAYLLPAFLLAAPPAFGEGLDEDFENAKPGAVLNQGDLPGWKQLMHEADSAPEGAAFIDPDAGFPSGQGLRLAEKGTFVVYETGRSLWTDASGPGTLHLDLRVEGGMPVELMIHNGSGSAGMLLLINNRDHSVMVSKAGSGSPYRGPKNQYEVPGLESGVWYRLEIRDIQLASSDDAPTAGKVFLYEANKPSNILLDGVEIAATGSVPFQTLKTLRVRRWGGPGDVLDLDNLRFQAASQ